MSNALHWMPTPIGDLLRETMHLRRDDLGSYVSLQWAYWNNQGPLRDDNEELSAIAKCDPKEWEKTVRARMERFFTVTEGFWHHARTDEKLAEAKSKSASASASANAKWAALRAHTPRNANGHATASATAQRTDSVGKANGHAPAMLLTTHNSQSDSELTEVQQLGSAKRRRIEKAAMKRAGDILGDTVMVEFGGQWRNRFRENAGKFERVMNAVEQEKKEGKEIENFGGYANDLWKRFAD